MELKLPELTRASRVPNINVSNTTKALNMPMVRSKTRLESFCENCRQHSIKWGFCFICGLEVR